MKVARAVPKPALWESQMRELFKQVRFREAGALYDEAVATGQRPSAEMDTLKARTVLNEDAQGALEFLSQRLAPAGDPALRVYRELLTGIAYARLGNFDLADKHLAVSIPAEAPAATRALQAYHCSRRYMLEMRLNDALQHWERTRVDTSAYGKIRSEHLRSSIFGREERYAEQAEGLLSTIRLIVAGGRENFLEEWYWAVHTLSGLARELNVPEAVTITERELNVDIEWPPDFAVNHFQALKALGWCKGLAGDQLGCFRYLRQAQDLDVAAAWKTIVLLDRSYLARAVGEKQWATNELLAAEQLSKDIKWEACGGEERVGLLLFAELFSMSEPKRAAEYLERYLKLGDLRASAVPFTFDRRLRAMSEYTSGVVGIAKGNKEVAVAALRSAWGVFDAIGYDWRAARTAMRLLEVSGKDRWRHLAEEKLEAYPRSWLASELKGLAPSPERRPRLPRMQQKIFEMLCAGMSTEDIATQLGRSHYTVRNHIKLIFKAFGVRSRHSLVALAAKKNLIA